MKTKKKCQHKKTKVVDLSIDRLEGTVICAKPGCGHVIRSYSAG